MNMPKFMQTLDQEIYEQLQEIANKRGIKVQELIRAVIVPEWFKQRRRTPQFPNLTPEFFDYLKRKGKCEVTLDELVEEYKRWKRK